MMRKVEHTPENGYAIELSVKNYKDLHLEVACYCLQYNIFPIDVTMINLKTCRLRLWYKELIPEYLTDKDRDTHKDSLTLYQIHRTMEKLFPVLV